MNDMGIRTLIADGENETVDFKREIKLDSAKDKAEFVKDVISLANSSHGTGFLLIGIDDDKYVVGNESLPEEQIQQIAHTYITPSLRLCCYSVPMMAPMLPSVGVIEVEATEIPHKVARAIGKLEQDDVFVRRGSIIGKASPEEIIRMHNNGKLKKTPNRQFSDSSEEKKWHFSRLKSDKYSSKERDENLKWLKANTSGYELGKVLYYEARELDAYMDESLARKAKLLLDEAIGLGYETSDVYYLRAETNRGIYNYGFALQDINEAIDKSNDNENDYVMYLALKAGILVNMNRFSEALQTLSRGQRLDGSMLHNYLDLIPFDLSDNILRRYALSYEFGGINISEPKKIALIALAVWKGRNVVEINKYSTNDVRVKTELDVLEKQTPGILMLIRNLIGEEYWERMMNDSDISVKYSFPKIKDRLSSIDWSV